MDLSIHVRDDVIWASARLLSLANLFVRNPLCGTLSIFTRHVTVYDIVVRGRISWLCVVSRWPAAANSIVALVRTLHSRELSSAFGPVVHLATPVFVPVIFLLANQIVDMGRVRSLRCRRDADGASGRLPLDSVLLCDADRIRIVQLECVPSAFLVQAVFVPGGVADKAFGRPGTFALLVGDVIRLGRAGVVAVVRLVETDDLTIVLLYVALANHDT